MKISELLSTGMPLDTNGITNSYIVLNYAPDGETEPLTQKISLDDLVKIIGYKGGFVQIGANSSSDEVVGTNRQALAYGIDGNPSEYVTAGTGKYIPTAEEINKLAGVAAGAEVNVQANWTESNSSSDAYIQNKPTLGTVAAKDYDSSITESSISVNIPTSAAVAGIVSPKADKVTGATNGNFASLDTNGNLVDSGHKHSDYLVATLKGANSGLAELDAAGKVPTSQLPSYVDDVIEGYFYDNAFYEEAAHTTSITGESGKIYVDLSGGRKVYRWGGSAFAEIPIGLALGTTSDTAYRGDYGDAAYAHAVTNKGVSAASGLYKITTNSEGHVTAATTVEKADITALGIPGSDTTYSTGTSFTDGLTKLYSNYGSNTDGGLTQNAFTVLIASLVNNFGLVPRLPSNVAINEDTTEGVITVAPSFTSEDMTIIIQKQGENNTWTTYNEGDAWTAGDIFRAYATRTIAIGSSNFTNEGVIGNTHTATESWAPESSPEEA